MTGAACCALPGKRGAARGIEISDEKVKAVGGAGGPVLGLAGLRFSGGEKSDVGGEGVGWW